MYELGPDAAADIAGANERLAEIEVEIATDGFPLDETATAQLYAAIAEKVAAIFEAESAAAQRLAAVASHS